MDMATGVFIVLIFLSHCYTFEDQITWSSNGLQWLDLIGHQDSSLSKTHQGSVIDLFG